MLELPSGSLCALSSDFPGNKPGILFYARQGHDTIQSLRLPFVKFLANQKPLVSLQVLSKLEVLPENHFVGLDAELWH